jgi:hypothetical protein
MERIHHTWDKWECYPSGFYENRPASLKAEDAEGQYADFLSDSSMFRAAGQRLLREWPNSCEHYLTNESMNRIAWIGQACACLGVALPSCCRSGFRRLSEGQQTAANMVALGILNEWLVGRGESELSMAGAESRTKADLY